MDEGDGDGGDGGDGDVDDGNGDDGDGDDGDAGQDGDGGGGGSTAVRRPRQRRQSPAAAQASRGGHARGGAARAPKARAGSARAPPSCGSPFSAHPSIRRRFFLSQQQADYNGGDATLLYTLPANLIHDRISNDPAAAAACCPSDSALAASLQLHDHRPNMNDPRTHAAGAHLDHRGGSDSAGIGSTCGGDRSVRGCANLGFVVSSNEVVVGDLPQKQRRGAALLSSSAVHAIKRFVPSCFDCGSGNGGYVGDSGGSSNGGNGGNGGYIGDSGGSINGGYGDAGYGDSGSRHRRCKMIQIKIRGATSYYSTPPITAAASSIRSPPNRATLIRGLTPYNYKSSSNDSSAVLAPPRSSTHHRTSHRIITASNIDNASDRGGISICHDRNLADNRISCNDGNTNNNDSNHYYADYKSRSIGSTTGCAKRGIGRYPSPILANHHLNNNNRNGSDDRSCKHRSRTIDGIRSAITTVDDESYYGSTDPGSPTVTCVGKIRRGAAQCKARGATEIASSTARLYSSKSNFIDSAKKNIITVITTSARNNRIYSNGIMSRIYKQHDDAHHHHHHHQRQHHTDHHHDRPAAMNHARMSIYSSVHGQDLLMF